MVKREYLRDLAGKQPAGIWYLNANRRIELDARRLQRTDDGRGCSIRQRHWDFIGMHSGQSQPACGGTIREGRGMRKHRISHTGIAFERENNIFITAYDLGIIHIERRKEN